MNSPWALDVRSGRRLDPAGVSDEIERHGPARARDLHAPFAAVWMPGNSDTLLAATDPWGLGQLFYAQTASGVAISNSAALLGAYTDSRLDIDGLIGFALLGTYPGQRTGFQQVVKVPPATILTVQAGEARLETIAEPARPRGSGHIDQLADILRRSVKMMSEAAPDADLQLSGGLDSRLILAALPRDTRRRHSAITIGTPDSRDVIIARQLTERLGLRHRVVHTDDILALGADELDGLLRMAAAGFDFGGNPVDKASLLTLEDRLGSKTWFGGQNGEVIRGFYYAGQPLRATPAASLARQLIGWRLTANDQVDARIFDQDTYGQAKARVEEHLVNRFTSIGRDWSEALDLYYVKDRMQRWGGNGLDSLLNRRTYLCPFFDPEFIQEAIAIPPEEKADGRVAMRLLHRLDPELASVPLDTGIVPAKLSRGGLAAELDLRRRFLEKGFKRVRQRFTKQTKPTFGSDAIIELWYRHGLYRRLPYADLARTGIFDPAMLERLEAGSWRLDRATLGFVLMASGLAGTARCAGR